LDKPESHRLDYTPLAGRTTGITQGEIIGTLKTYKKCSFSKEETLKNIITDFSLSEEDARNYMEKYW